MPMLEAREASSQFDVIAAATGHFSPDAVGRMRRSWQQQAAGPSFTPRKPRFNLAALSDAGIAVKLVKADKPA